MAAPAVVQAPGLRKLQRDLKALGVDAQDLKAANIAASTIVVTASRPRAPRRTGALAASVKAARTQGRARVRSSLRYSAYQHWSKKYGHPWVTEAAEATRPAWLAAYQQDLTRLVNSVNGKTY